VKGATALNPRLAALMVGTAMALATLAAGYLGESVPAQAAERPNIIFILTDDQDAESIRYMPTVQRELVQKGTTFENGILTLTECCPSRATMLRGQYAHNHRIGLGAKPNALTFRRHGLETSTVATWLNRAGYRTGLVGKYLNGYDHRYVPRGWDRWYANVGEPVWSECLNENGQERCYGGKHPDAVLADKAEGFVRSSKGGSDPLFLWLAFGAPHNPAPHMHQDRNKFSSVPLPKSPSFNERDVSDKPAWVRNKPQLKGEEIKKMTGFYRDRLRSLQTVDRAVGRLVDALDDTGRLENTYIVFWTDNGHHMGEHRLGAFKGTPGKTTPYVEDTRVPLVVRGPGVPHAERPELVLNTDIAPTFAALGGTQPDDFVDGRSFAPLLEGGTPNDWRTTALIENRRSKKLRRPAYAGLIAEDSGSDAPKDTAYVEYDGGDRELYDLADDPYQLENAFAQDPPPDRDLVAGLEQRLDDLRHCRATACFDAENGELP
jgi:arylsulfatase A-like enzyme